jgi:hypothetical protein
MSKSMPFTSATTLHDLGAFVFGDHALHLQKQIFPGADTDRAVPFSKLLTLNLPITAEHNATSPRMSDSHFASGAENGR